VEQRRRGPRRGACWPGRFKAEGHRRGQWHECLVVNISPLGVGLDLDGPIPKDLIGQRIAVEFHIPAGISVNIRLMGEVRHVANDVRGGARIGMEFVGLSETERNILGAIEPTQVG
jgi:hypothetical protein